MKKLAHILLVVILLFLVNSTISYASTKKKLLIYGFENIIQGSSKNKTLSAKLSEFIYDQLMNSKRKKYRVYIVNTGGNRRASNQNKTPGVEQDYMYSIAKERGFDLVLFGFYSLSGIKIKLFPKLLLVDRNIVVNADKLYPNIYEAVEKAEKLGFDGLIAYKSNRKLKKIYINPKSVEVIEETKSEENNINYERKENKTPFHLPIRFEISNSTGILLLTDTWDVLYSSGFFNNIDLSILSAKRNFPISLTIKTMFSIFNAEKNSDYIDSSLNMFYLGLGLDYNLYFNKFIKAIRFSTSGGFTHTLLEMSYRDFESFDPTGNLSLNIIFKISKEINLKLSIGGVFISYVDYPFKALEASAGISFGN